MKFLICPFGTAGDVYPFLAIGLGLQKRGHDVCIICHTPFGEVVRKFGLEFGDLNDLDEYRTTHDHPDIWHPTRGPVRGTRYTVRSVMRPQYEEITKRYEPGKTVLVAPGSSFGAKIAHEKHGMPFVTGFNTPFFVRSEVAPPVLPAGNPPRVTPRWGVRFFYWVLDVFLVDPLIKPEINRFRAELGLPPTRRILSDWYLSEQLIIGLFPDWFGMAPPDWPKHLKMTGFPMFDARESDDVPPAVRAFLDAGDPPVICTPGTQMANARPFFDACLEACRTLGRRAVFLTRFVDQVPPNLPDSVLHVSYLPFSQVLPKGAAVVSHGGIGTLSQALAAGIPQLIMPMTYDQPDNAARLFRLGVGRALRPKRFTGPNVARELAALLDDPAVRERARELARRFPAGDPVKEACDVLEEFAKHHLAV